MLIDKNYIGIYSFPKSGNTYVRQIISEYYNSEISNIVDTHQQPIKNSIPLGSEGIRFYKSHAKTLNTSVKNKAIIYISRHPLDVFLSQLNFYSQNVAPNPDAILTSWSSVDYVVNEGLLDYFFGCFLVHGTLDTKFGNISGNWFSNMEYFWNKKHIIDNNGKNVKVISIKYEDLVSNPLLALKEFSEYLNLDQIRLESAIYNAKNKTSINGKFFWKQQPKLYEEILTFKQIQDFYKVHKEKLNSLKYQLD